MKPTVAFTIGDINGIGPEVILKSIAEKKNFNDYRPVLIGPDRIWQNLSTKLNLKLKFEPFNSKVFKPGIPSILDLEYPGKPEYGKISANSGLLSIMSIFAAYNLCKLSIAQAMVTAPISKEAINLAGFKYDGHTGLLADLSKNRKICMMLLSDFMRVGLVTTHLPVNRISSNLSQKVILEKLEILHCSLQNDFRISKPKIAVLGLNPHAGDGGILGNEEKIIIEPAISKALNKGIKAFGPFASDAFFARYVKGKFDAILAMYHDQGLIPLKMTDNNRGINYTLGLNIIRTSPDHGTGFDIAGRHIADPGSTISALNLALDLIKIKNRKK